MLNHVLSHLVANAFKKASALIKSVFVGFEPDFLFWVLRKPLTEC